MERLFLIADPEKFKGTAEATVYTENNIQYVDCTGYLYNNDGQDLTVEQYQVKMDYQNAIILTWDEMYLRFMSSYLKSLQGAFEEITDKQYNDALECLPPKRWTNKPGQPEFFFIGECFTVNLYGCYMSWQGKYYTALREINTTSEALYNDLLNQIQP